MEGHGLYIGRLFENLRCRTGYIHENDFDDWTRYAGP